MREIASKVLVLAAGICVSTFANADASKFYDPVKLPERLRPAEYEHLVGATGAVATAASSHEILGAATVISKDGYVLTALHLVTQFLTSGTVPSSRGGLVGIGVPDDVSHPAGLPGFWLTFDSPKQIFSGAETVLLGRNTVDEDYAILRLQLDEKALPCVPISKEPVTVGSDVWAFGYPDPVGELSTQARGKFVSLGTVTSDDRGRCLTCPAYYFVSNADSVFGMSGGIVADRSGSAIGVISRAVPSEDGRTNDTASVPLNWIWKQAVERLGADGANAVFNCR